MRFTATGIELLLSDTSYPQHVALERALKDDVAGPHGDVRVDLVKLTGSKAEFRTH
jgi:hypothetical protein